MATAADGEKKKTMYVERCFPESLKNVSRPWIDKRGSMTHSHFKD